MSLTKYIRPQSLLAIAILAHFALTFTFILTLRYELKTSGEDGALFAQLLYNALRGEGLLSTLAVPYTFSQNFLGMHFSPILYGLLPFYALFPHIETLLFVHCLAIAAAAWPLYHAAKAVLPSSWQALTVALLYLFNPYVVNAAIWDFHEIAFAPFIISCMLWAILTRQKHALILSSIALICVKEHYGLAVFGAGLLWTRHWNDWRFGPALAVAGLAALFIVLFVLIPIFNPLGISPMMNSDTQVDRFSWLSNPLSPGSESSMIITAGLLYVFAIMIPLWFLPLAAPFWLLPGMADFAVNMLSANNMPRLIISYHSLPLIPVLLIATVMAIVKWSRRSRRLTTRDLVIVVSLLGFPFGIMASALPINEESNVWEFSEPRFSLPATDKAAVMAIERQIPPDAAVAAQENALPHLTTRAVMHVFPYFIGETRHIVLHTGFPFKQRYLIIGAPYGVFGETYFTAVHKLFANPEWGVVYYNNQWVLVEKGGSDNAEARQQALESLAKTEQHYFELKKKTEE